MQLLDIAYRPKVKAPMLTTSQAMVTKLAGVDGDARGKPGKRQVTVLSAQQWYEACAELKVNLPWTTRRANLLVDGVSFDESFVGKQLQLGQLILWVMGETDPCPKMDAQQPGLMHALRPYWRGGVCCKVLASGRVKVGDRLIIR